MNAIVKAETAHEIMETVLIKGDLSKLTSEERNSYYFRLCESVGLNPLTQPLQYITLSGKLTLYAKKDCTDQLRSIHDISVTDLTKETIEGVHIVTAKVQNAKGRTDADIGAVNIAGLKGEAFANAIMKASTKAKRRATLSICGLGLLDETEIEDILASQKPIPERSRVPSPDDVAPKASSDPEPPQTPCAIVVNRGGAKGWAKAYTDMVLTSADPATVMQWVDANQHNLETLGSSEPTLLADVRASVSKHLAFLRKTAPKDDPISSGRQRPGSEVSGDPVDDMPDRGNKIVKTAKGEMPNIQQYDDWIMWAVNKLATTDAGDALNDFFESLDPFWADIKQPDREMLLGAKRSREDEQAP
jgi:hypothetical protein